MKRSIGTCALVCSGVMAVASTTQAATVEINQFLPPVITPQPDDWHLSDIRGGGTASIDDLTGLGGDLENNQPLPTGAARLFTGFDNNDKAEVGTFQDFGDAATVLGTVLLGYDYYKQTVVGGNAFAAPTLKLTIANTGGTGDNFGQLVFEPTWNQPVSGSQAVPTDAWQSVSIDPNTGDQVGDASGGWWWTGGFEIPNSFGGPPLRSLAEWVTAFTASDAVDFAGARVVGLSVGVGTFNQGQVGYFDEVSITIPGGTSTTYDFEVPEPASLALLGLGGMAVLRRSRA